MKKRPVAVTVISWFLIITGGISLVTSALMANNPMTRELMSKSPLPIPIQFAMLYAGLAVSITSGIAMLKGLNWGRLLYVIWSAAGFTVTLATSPMKAALIPGLVIYAVIVLLLFSSKAREYFGSDGAERVAESN